MLTNLAELTQQTSVDKTVEVAKEVAPTGKGANGETGVAGNNNITESTIKKGVKSRGEGGNVGGTGGGSRRTTSLLNLFMSNSQGRSLRECVYRLSRVLYYHFFFFLMNVFVVRVFFLFKYT